MVSSGLRALSAFFFLFSLVFLSSVGFAVFVQVSAVGGPFITDSNILVIAKVYDNNGDLKNNVDLNTYVVNLSTGAASDINYHGNVQGKIIRALTVPDAGDYNIVAVDLNNNVNSKVTIKVRSVSRTVAAFYPHNPPFNKTSGEDINFSLQAKNTSNADVNVMLVARLLSDANNSQASSQIDVNANGLTTYAFDTAGLPQGLYFIDVNQGLSLIPATVFQYKGFLDIKDDQNNSVVTFGQGKTVFVIAKATNFDGNSNQTISSISISVTDPEGDTNSSIPCDTNGQIICQYFVRSDSNAGDYTISATITVSGDTLKMKRIFSVQTYNMKFFAQTFSGGDAGKEKMPSVYPTNSSVPFEAHFLNTANSTELTGSDLNYTFCQDANISVFIKKVGDKDDNAMSDTTSWTSSNSNYCTVRITAPSTQGTFTVTAVAKYGSQTLRKSATLLVQNFMIFMSPVAADTFDPNTPSGKFGFFRDENLGFNPNYVDLNGSLNPRISKVTRIDVIDGSTVKTFTASSDINWNSDKNILTLSAAALRTLSGGFRPVTATVDVNAADANHTGITAFAMFKLNVLNLSATLVDSNVALTATAKSQSFGPTSVSLDENIHIKVTATNGSGSGVSGATVSLRSLRNVDTWQEVTVSGVASRTTDANGVAILDMNSLSYLGLSGGAYFGEALVTATDGNVDTAQFFFEARAFMAFLQPVDPNSGTACNFVQNFRRDENATFIIRAFNPQQGFGSGDVNVIVGSSGAAKLFYFGMPSKPQFPPAEVSVSYDVNSQYPCMAQGPGGAQARNVTMIKFLKPASNWTTGFYNPIIKVTALGTGDINGKVEIGRGFMNVQSFTFLVNPSTTGQFGPPTGKPGQPFDLNVSVLGSSSDVNITAKLVDAAGGGKFEFNENGSSTQDLNIGFATADIAPVSNLDCNSSRCPAKGVVVKAVPTASDRNVLSVIIPSNTKSQEYLIQLTATDTSGTTATGDIFLTTKLFKIVKFNWFQNIYGVFGVSNLGQADWNTSVTSSSGIRYQQAYTSIGGMSFGGPNGPPTIDRNLLIDYTGRTIIADAAADRNFVGDTNITVATGTASSPAVPGALVNFDGNMFKVVDISRVGIEPGVKIIRLSALTATEGQGGYMGVYPADVNFTIPVLVKDVNGSPIDANVTVTNIARITPGSFAPQMMAVRSCSTLSQLQVCIPDGSFQSVYGKTDANGLALLTLQVNKPGTFLMLELTVWNTSSGGTVLNQTQKMQPFEGPTIDVKKYTVSSKVTGPTMIANYDTATDLNIQIPEKTADVNRNSAIKYNGTSTNANQSNSNGVLGDINSGLVWWIQKMYDGNGTWFVIDDDSKLIRSAAPYMDQDSAEGGAFVESICLDLNSDCDIVKKDGTVIPLHWETNANIDGNKFDANTAFYTVYEEPFGTNVPNYDSNIQLAISLVDLAGASLGDIYSISDIRLESQAMFQTYSVTPSSYSNKVGTTLIDLGNFSTKNIPGPQSVVFKLTVGTTTTEERIFFSTRRPTS